VTDQKVEVAEPEVKYRGNTYFEYSKFFGFKAEDLKDKRILDLGSGHDSFSRSVKSLFPQLDTEIVSLDIENQTNIDRAKHVNGTTYTLPFKDNSFDLVLAHLSIPLWLFDPKDKNRDRSEYLKEAIEKMQAVLREAARVLRPGGEAKFSPWGFATNLSTRDNIILREEFTRGMQEATANSADFTFSMETIFDCPLGHLTKKS